ncbi:Outer-membrane lipoprotein LolB [Nitrosospira sp. NRS527]|nr:Outer-membrane lipoprotein LolB [Nitrosospira sp. NRS527]
MSHSGIATMQSVIRVSSSLKQDFVFSWQVFIFCIPFIPVLFSGCATLSTHAPKNAVRTIVIEPVAGLTNAISADFGLIGRVSVKGGKESFSGGVQWHHSGGGDEILLLSPLGQTLAQIQRTPEGVYLTTSEHKRYYATDVESLTEQALGWRLPLMGLQYWVQSLNAPTTASAIDLDMDGSVAAIRQDGWEIDYSGHAPVALTQTGQSGTTYPRLLVLRRNGLQIKLIIDNWNPGDR